MGKQKSRRLLFAAVILVVVIAVSLIVFLGLQSSQGRVPGVKAGDVFIYDITGSWSSNDPNATVPETFLQLNSTEWYKVTVTDVNGSKVTVNTNWRFENGTELDTTVYIDIETGSTFPSDYFSRVYAANLKAGDILRPSGMERVAINDTTTRNYAGGVTRETNVVEQSREFYDADDPTGGTTWNRFVRFQFDKQTGMLVQLSDVSIYNNPQLLLSTTWILKESNVWAVS